MDLDTSGHILQIERPPPLRGVGERLARQYRSRVRAWENDAIGPSGARQTDDGSGKFGG